MRHFLNIHTLGFNTRKNSRYITRWLHFGTLTGCLLHWFINIEFFNTTHLNIRTNWDNSWAASASIAMGTGHPSGTQRSESWLMLPTEKPASVAVDRHPLGDLDLSRAAPPGTQLSMGVKGCGTLLWMRIWKNGEACAFGCEPCCRQMGSVLDPAPDAAGGGRGMVLKGTFAGAPCSGTASVSCGGRS